MVRRHLHIWVSIVGAVLISIFADYTRYNISYLLRMPGYILAQYVSIYMTIRIGQDTFYLSVIRVAIFSIMIYAVIRLFSWGRKWRHQISLEVPQDKPLKQPKDRNHSLVVT